MSNKKTRHYRVVKKEVEQDPHNGVFISNDKKNQAIILAACLMFIVFIKGLVFGLIVGHKKH